MQSKGEIVIYKSPEGKTELEVNLKDETVWLTLEQIARLFSKVKSTISYHISSIYKEKELQKKSTVRKFRTVQIEGYREIERNLEYYNLDVIISVGYRVKSKRGTQFRIWANKVLIDYLVKGYALNEKRLKEQKEKVKELEKSIEVFRRVANNHQLQKDEFSGIINVISDYTYALDILDQYDHQNLKKGKVEKNEEYKITYEDSVKVINKLKNKFGGRLYSGRRRISHLRVQ